MAWLVWLIVGVVLLGVEAISLAFVAVYFGVAALFAALVAAIGGPAWSQVVCFGAASLLGLVLTRRIATRVLRGPAPKTNVQTLVGRRGVVTKTLGDDATGQIRVGTEYWTARTYFEDAGEVPPGSKVEVMSIEGVTAVVMPLELAEGPDPSTAAS